MTEWGWDGVGRKHVKQAEQLAKKDLESCTRVDFSLNLGENGSRETFYNVSDVPGCRVSYV